MIFPGTEAYRLVDHSSSFLPLICWAPGTSPDPYDFPDIRESGLATTPANSLRTLGCIALILMDLRMFRAGGHDLVCTCSREHFVPPVPILQSMFSGGVGRKVEG